ncbi:hypothetical protein ACIQNU_37610 [Streptomyces sp. NPDC091292]|uniref:hypothetical protein n=1 Tax=Streptomyces sp. NPDC091292 TaxID=3365991 RepID=UPI0037F149A7
MPRIVPFLAVGALVTLSVFSTVSTAYAEPSAEVRPHRVEPGGSVEIHVSCERGGGHEGGREGERGGGREGERGGGRDPEFIEAHSQAFEDGRVKLHRASGNEDRKSGASYRGHARIARGENFEGGPHNVGPVSEWSVEGHCPGERRWSASFTVVRETGVRHGVHAGEGGTFTDSRTALVTGGVLIAGALGAAVYRVRRKDADSETTGTAGTTGS